MFPVSKVSSLHEMRPLLSPSSLGVVHLEVPQEVVGLFEVWPHGDHFVHQILHANDTHLAQSLLNDGVVRQRNSLVVHSTITTLVN